MAYVSQLEQLGQEILKGTPVQEMTLRNQKFSFEYTPEDFKIIALANGWPEPEIDKILKDYKPTQSRFISNFKDRYCLQAGGYGSGKTLSLLIKLILTVKCFPNNRVLLGRKTLADIDRVLLPDLFELMPPQWYEHRVKDGVINFKNGSQIVLFGLDAMQSGSVADIKKAEQKLKSLNIGAWFIDQLEEIEYRVFVTLNSRLRRTNVPFRQGNATCNPANFWAYHYFVDNKTKGIDDDEWVEKAHKDSKLYKSSMLYNPHLSWDYIQDQMNRGEAYVKRYVYGDWDTDILTSGNVFADEHIRYLKTFAKQPVANEEGCEIYEQPVPGVIYQMGVDPSEGVVDPSSISVVSSDGKKVAKFNGKLPIQGLADKVKFLFYKYGRPLIVPEANAAGAALVREIRDLRVYRRKQLDHKTDKETEKLGFKTSWETKAQLINHFQKLLRKKTPTIYDRKTIEEMKTFVWTDSASQQGAGAAPGFHDDDVMSTMLAYWDMTPEKGERILFAKQHKPTKRRPQYM